MVKTMEMKKTFFGIEKQHRFYDIFSNIRAYRVICGPEDIVSKLEVVESDSKDAYWAWESDGQLGLIYPAEFLFNMCFPYGYEAEVRKGRGKVIRLEVEEIESKTRFQWEQEIQNKV